MDRNDLRKGYKNLRENLSLAYQQSAAKQVCQRLQFFQPYIQAKHIALYHAFKSELSLQLLWEVALTQKKICYFPFLRDDKTLGFAPANANTVFAPNRYGIFEPQHTEENAVDPAVLDLMFLPLLAFDIHGTRIGFGQGFYDRTLAASRTPSRIGVAYPFQRVFSLDASPWDIPLTHVVTPDGLIYCDRMGKC
ncbi:MAG: 5-formyltetrahydrofolate cyclo-ligase [Legionella sp.]|nr:5-formyltetrahydrofolate cyclo-ligase [Legionella sp.]